MFRLLGFDVHIRPGFVVFALLIIFLYGDEFGLWLAGALTVFTIVHELGHAVAARRAGAKADVSLNFMVGYTSYRPTRPMSRLEQIGISFAGPAVHIATSVAVLLAMGVSPFDLDAVDQSDAALAIWWAGPVIGTINLIPVLPLDGGNIALEVVDSVAPTHSRRVMLWFSIAATVAFGVWGFLSGFAGVSIFIAFLLLAQFQMLNATRPQAQPRSAWEAAAAALDAGKPQRAQRMLVNSLSHPQPTPTNPNVRLTSEQANGLLDLLPDPLPHGDPSNEFVLANLLVATGRFDDAAHYAAGSFQRNPNTLSAVVVARSAAALGDHATAIAWLHTAADAGTSPDALAIAIDRAPELIGVRQHPDVQAIRRRLAPDPLPGL